MSVTPPGGVHALTALVLVNAVYFKGSWTHKFDVAQTKSEPFTCADGSRVNVPMMAQREEFRHASHAQLGARSLVLDYDVSVFWVVFYFLSLFTDAMDRDG